MLVPIQARTTFVRLFRSWSDSFVAASRCCFSSGAGMRNEFWLAFQSFSMSSFAVTTSSSKTSLPFSPLTFLAPPRSFAAPLSPFVPLERLSRRRSTEGHYLWCSPAEIMTVIWRNSQQASTSPWGDEIERTDYLYDCVNTDYPQNSRMNSHIEYITTHDRWFTGWATSPHKERNSY